MIEWIVEQVKRGNYQLKLHVAERAIERGIDPLHIKEALLCGRVIEDYPDDKRGHSCLVWGKDSNGRDIHMVCGVAYEILWIITAYLPDEKEWETPWMRRKS